METSRVLLRLACAFDLPTLSTYVPYLPPINGVVVWRDSIVLLFLLVLGAVKNCHLKKTSRLNHLHNDKNVSNQSYILYI